MAPFISHAKASNNPAKIPLRYKYWAMVCLFIPSFNAKWVKLKMPPIHEQISVISGAGTADHTEHLSSPSDFSWVRVTRSLVLLYVMFCRSLLILVSIFFWPLCCLSFFDLLILITSLWYLQALLSIVLFVFSDFIPKHPSRKYMTMDGINGHTIFILINRWRNLSIVLLMVARWHLIKSMSVLRHLISFCGQFIYTCNCLSVYCTV